MAGGEPEAGAAFDAFYRAQFTRAARLAYLLTGDPGASEDMAQEALSRVQPRYDGLDAPVAYLRTVVVNLAKRHRGDEARLRFAREQLGIDQAESPAARELLDVIAALPRRQRAVIVLRYYEDLSEAEIANALRCRPGTVKSLASRALATLREALES